LQLAETTQYSERFYERAVKKKVFPQATKSSWQRAHASWPESLNATYTPPCRPLLLLFCALIWTVVLRGHNKTVPTMVLFVTPG